MQVRVFVRGEMADRAKFTLPVGDGGMRMREILAQIAIRLRQSFAKNFAAGGRPAWPPLSERTQKEKLALYFAGRLRGRKPGAILEDSRRPQPMAPGALFPLVRTGAGRESVVQRGAPGNVTRITPSRGEVEVGTNIGYMAIQRAGSPKTNLPPRDFLTVPDEDLDDIAAMVSNLLLDPREFRRLGLGGGGE